MWYIVLTGIIAVLIAAVFALLQSICSINRQIRQKRQIRVSLSNRHIEQLAYEINQKDELHKKLQIQMKREEERRKQAISNISHDLRTPLTSIRGYLTLLQECEDEEERRQYLEIIRSKTDYLTCLVQEFYDLSVIENEQTQIPVQKVDINRIVTECVLEKYYEFGDIQPVIRTENAPVWICGNETVCRRIVENLVVNAIRYAEQYIEISIDSAGIFTVKNRTHTLSDTDVKRMFEKFYTAHKPGTDGSSGLGLYIVKELLGKINGKIWSVTYEDALLTISVRFAGVENDDLLNE